LLFGVREPGQEYRAGGTTRPAIWLADLGRFGAAYWLVVLVGAVLTLARFSEAFLVLRASGVGLTAALVPLVMVAMNVVYAASAYPAGVLADRLDRRALLAAGLAALIAADIVLALAAGVAQVMVGVALWGLHMGLTQGLLATLVADASPPHLRGSAFGVSNLVSGLVLLAAKRARRGALGVLRRAGSIPCRCRLHDGGSPQRAHNAPVPTGPRRARTLQWPYWLIFHEDGVAGERRSADADAVVLEHALRYHGGGFAGSGILPEEVPIIARRGELVVPPERIVGEEKPAREQRPITVVVNVTAADASSFRASQGQIAADMARAIDRASRNR
jgi:hypothetical protein